MTSSRRYLENLADSDKCFAHKAKGTTRSRVLCFRKGKPWPEEVEVLGTDSYAAAPAGSFGFTADVAGTQSYIRDEIQKNDQVELRLCPVYVEGTRRSCYTIHHKQTSVGITDPQVDSSLKRALTPPWAYGSFNVSWPDQIDGVRVQDIDSVAGTPLT